MHQLITDTRQFIRNKSSGEIILLSLYVDDLYLATIGITSTWGEIFEFVNLAVGKTIRKLINLLNLDGSEIRKVPIAPDFSSTFAECPTAEEIASRFYQKRTKLYQKIWARASSSTMFADQIFLLL